MGDISLTHAREISELRVHGLYTKAMWHPCTLKSKKSLVENLQYGVFCRIYFCHSIEILYLCNCKTRRQWTELRLRNKNRFQRKETFDAEALCR